MAPCPFTFLSDDPNRWTFIKIPVCGEIYLGTLSISIYIYMRRKKAKGRRRVQEKEKNKNAGREFELQASVTLDNANHPGLNQRANALTPAADFCSTVRPPRSWRPSYWHKKELF